MPAGGGDGGTGEWTLNDVTPDPDLLRACLAAPLDAAPRLVLADWLEERGWGDRLLLTALRGKGKWLVGDRREAVWDADDLDVLVREVYGPAVSVVSGGVGEDGPSSLQLGFGKAPDGTRCHACRRTTSLEAAKSKDGGQLACWEHREIRRRQPPAIVTVVEARWEGDGPAEIGQAVEFASDTSVRPSDAGRWVIVGTLVSGNVQVRAAGQTYPSVELWRGLDDAERMGLAVLEAEARELLGLREPEGK